MFSITIIRPLHTVCDTIIFIIYLWSNQYITEVWQEMNLWNAWFILNSNDPAKNMTSLEQHDSSIARHWQLIVTARQDN